MEKRTKLGVAATSLAVAATMIGPTTASAVDICVEPFCPPTPGEDDYVFYKLEDAYLKFAPLVTAVIPGEVLETIGFEDVFLKMID